ncbi:MAG: hypothetical protein KJZ54_08750 [Phycisphaerales bacterium]|nr:hypothetical protein [Phycisphaerales bacterium]
MATANIISKRVSVSSTDGWVRLADESVVVDADIRAATNNTVSLRPVGDDSPAADCALLSAASHRLYGVDLAALEISTTSGVPIAVHIIGQSTGYRR